MISSHFLRTSGTSTPTRRHSAPEGKKSPLLGSVSDLDSEAVSDSESISGDEYDLDDEDKALIMEYLNDPPSLHVRRYVLDSF